MDWSKVDAGLAGALADARPDDRFLVFVHVVGPVDPGEAAALEAGRSGPSGDRTVHTVVLPPAQIDLLSERPWVSRLQLSRTLPPPAPP